VDRKPKIERFRMGVDLILESWSKSYMNSQPFAEYISMVLLPYIDELRLNEEFADTETILLMDNYSIQVQAETLQKLADHRVKVITFPPHTTKIFQCFDLSLFGNCKKKMNYRLPLESDEDTAGLIKGIFHQMKQIFVGITYEVFLCNLVSNIILRQPRISFTSTRVCFGEVQGPLRFGRAITLLRNYRTENEIPHSDGLIG
jgi:hypothetical protein